MGLKIAKVVYDATKSLMSNPIAKTVGIGAIFGAGVLLGNQVGLDSFEKTRKNEMISTPSEEAFNESEITSTPTKETTVKELAYLIKASDYKNEGIDNDTKQKINNIKNKVVRFESSEYDSGKYYGYDKQGFLVQYIDINNSGIGGMVGVEVLYENDNNGCKKSCIQLVTSRGKKGLEVDVKTREY